MKLDLGGGNERLPGWTVVDLYTNTDIKDDIRTLATVGDNTIEELRAFHSLEHLGKSEILPALTNWYRVLQPGGKLTLMVPDLPSVILNWLEAYRNDPTVIWGWETQTIFGNQEHPGEFHKWGFDEISLRIYLADAGFSNIAVGFTDSHGQSCLVAVAHKEG